MILPWLYVSFLCDFAFIQEKGVITTQRTQSTQRSTLNFAPTGLGVIICEAANTIGKTEARANVIENNLNGDFVILDKNEMPIVIGDENVSVVCESSAFKYTELDWFKENDLVTNAMSMCCVEERK